RKNRDKFTTIPEGLFCPEVEEEGEVEGEVEEEGCVSRKTRSGCPFCRKPTKGPLQHYHDAARSVLGRCLIIAPAKAGTAIARLEKSLGRDRCHELFAAYLRSEDPFVLKQGHSLTTFCSESIQNGLAAAIAGGYTHGVGPGKAPSSRRRAPAPASEFGQTGEVPL
ncbi:MAG: hypothetical protein JXA57_16185, partial [Armatimonadetes bacterium]|nr:hypothetical protein [Armatimonadota bacterium]